jgi:hypothetical protein
MRVEKKFRWMRSAELAAFLSEVLDFIMTTAILLVVFLAYDARAHSFPMFPANPGSILRQDLLSMVKQGKELWRRVESQLKHH